MSWDYRICKSVYPALGCDNTIYSIREVYYDTDGAPTSWSVGAVTLVSISVEELTEDFELIKAAFEKEIIDLDKIKMSVVK